ncbi:MAG TPA: hypothetical protein VMV77_18370 [Bacteroidales bacterium]|nr:hypothetical protein [Bacteroidales bacterium]
MTIFNEYKRKPNFKKWVCPFDGKAINSRGAPAYLRNKYNVPWNKEFLNNPHLLWSIDDWRSKDELYIKIRGMFPIHKENDELIDKICERLFLLTYRIRRAIENKDISTNELHGVDRSFKIHSGTGHW